MSYRRLGMGEATLTQQALDLLADACMSKGGSFNYQTGSCFCQYGVDPNTGRCSAATGFKDVAKPPAGGCPSGSVWDENVGGCVPVVRTCPIGTEWSYATMACESTAAGGGGGGGGGSSGGGGVTPTSATSWMKQNQNLLIGAAVFVAVVAAVTVAGKSKTKRPV